MRRATIGAVSALGAVGIAAACWSATTRTNQEAADADWQAKWARRISGLDGLENVGEVASGVYRGAQPQGNGYASLKKLGVKTVISLRDLHDEQKEVLAAGMEPVSIPMIADVRGSRPPSREDIDRFLAVVLDPAKRPVYFHCAFGADRTGTMCAVYRMEVDGWTPDDARKEMDAYGFHTIWTNLSEFVQSYKRIGTWGVETAAATSR